MGSAVTSNEYVWLEKSGGTPLGLPVSTNRRSPIHFRTRNQFLGGRSNRRRSCPLGRSRIWTKSRATPWAVLRQWTATAVLSGAKQELSASAPSRLRNCTTDCPVAVAITSSPSGAGIPWASQSQRLSGEKL